MIWFNYQSKGQLSFMSIMGRPTKLNDELVELAHEYLLQHDISVGTLLPTIEGLAMHLNIRRDTLYEWETQNKEFSDILEGVRQMQASKLIQNSLVNRYNPTISKMLLSKHGYVEKTEKDIKVQEVTPILGGNTKADIIKTEEDE